MRVLVTKNQRARPDNTGVYLYKAGKTYGAETVPPMPADLAAVFVREDWGEEAKPAAVAKALPAAPENKMLDGAHENKAGDQPGAPADSDDDQFEVDLLAGNSDDGTGAPDGRPIDEAADGGDPEPKPETEAEPDTQDPLAAHA